MEKFRQYQRAEVTDAMYPLLHRRSFPVVRWEVGPADSVRRVQLELGPSNYQWFKRRQVMLFREKSEHALIDRKMNATPRLLEKLFRHKRIIVNL